MKDEQNGKDTSRDDGLDERIRNTADLLAAFVKENLPESEAEEIGNILKGITEE